MADQDAKIVTLDFPRKADKNLFTPDEMGQLALLYQKGQLRGLFKDRELIHENGASFWAFMGELDGEDITYAVVAKQNDKDTGNPKYFTRVIGLDARGNLSIPVDFVYEEFGRAEALLRYGIETGFCDEPVENTSVRYIGRPQPDGPRNDF